MKRQRTKLVCQLCNKEFYPISGNLLQQFCSRECGYLGRNVGGKKGKHYPHLYRARVGNCEVCGKEYRAVNDFKDKKQRFCSKECWAKRGYKSNKFVCLNCGNEFKYRYGKRLFCSRECAFKYKIGKNANQWKGGLTLKNDRARNGNKLKKWREAVFKRDNYICQKCGSKKEMQAHHIKSFSEYKDLRFVLDNGITVCIKCHSKIHNRDFTKRRKKKCILCGVNIVNKTNTGLCRSCAIKRNWKIIKNRT